MNRFLVISCVFAFSSLALGIVPASAQPAPSKKIKVFILSGQSGMAGFGRSHELPDALREGNDRVLMFEDGVISVEFRDGDERHAAGEVAPGSGNVNVNLRHC